MTGSGMEEGLLTTINAPAHKSAAFPGVMLFALIWLAAFVFAITSPVSNGLVAVILILGFITGAVAGRALTFALEKMGRRRRARFEHDRRIEQEREYRRKLAEAKAKGEI